MIDFERKEHYGLSDLLRIVALLRSEDGCPWDRVQTHASLRRSLLEEAYEAAEAIDREDPALLKEELGDLLLQVVFHADIERRAGNFTMDDVADGEVRKMLFRHPHVFGGQETVQDADTVLEGWEAIKRREKGQQTVSETLDAVARSLPATWRSEKLQKKEKRELLLWKIVGIIVLVALVGWIGFSVYQNVQKDASHTYEKKTDRNAYFSCSDRDITVCNGKYIRGDHRSGKLPVRCICDGICAAAAGHCDRSGTHHERGIYVPFSRDHHRRTVIFQF